MKRTIRNIFSLLLLAIVLNGCSKNKAGIKAEYKQMVKKTQFFSIEYDECSTDFVDNVTSVLEENLQRIMNFFELKTISSEVTIRIYSDFDEWKSFYESASGQQYQDYIVGCAANNIISVLAFDQYKKSNVHKNDSLEDFEKIIVHEFVHICHNQLDIKEYSFIIGEGLATYLANQRYNENIKIDFPKEVIFNYEKFFSITNDPYSFAQKIVRQITQKVSQQKLLEYAVDSSKLYDDWEELGL